jgi:hypothetical protein
MYYYNLIFSLYTICVCIWTGRCYCFLDKVKYNQGKQKCLNIKYKYTYLKISFISFVFFVSLLLYHGICKRNFLDAKINRLILLFKKNGNKFIVVTLDILYIS